MRKAAADTVFALSSAPGRAAVAVLRLSGPDSHAALRALTPRAALPPERAARLRTLRCPASGEPLDDALVLRFDAPRSFTGEDAAELHVHGSRAVVADVCDALARVPGLRAAEPGEFAQRALLNRKLRLTEAEGLADLLDAETSAQRRQAHRQLQGRLGDQVDAWRARAVRSLAHVEAVIDFGEGEDDVTDEHYAAAVEAVRALRQDLRAALADGRRGERLRDGVRVALFGPPNSGKSSLLNALARRDAAIVADQPGTTRDVVEVALDLAGVPVLLSDTAGVRDASDAVERAGVQRARAALAAADVRLLVLPDEGPPPADVLPLVTPDTVWVRNKADLRCRPSAGSISCLTGQGLGALEEDLARLARELCGTTTDSALITRARHRGHLEDCLAALDAFLALEDPFAAVDLAGEELRLAVAALGRITGRVDVEDVLDVLFGDFCIGK